MVWECPKWFGTVGEAEEMRGPGVWKCPEKGGDTRLSGLGVHVIGLGAIVNRLGAGFSGWEVSGEERGYEVEWLGSECDQLGNALEWLGRKVERRSRT